MKIIKIVIISTLLLITSIGVSQEMFVRKYNYIATWDTITKDFSEDSKLESSIIFNYSKNVHKLYTADDDTFYKLVQLTAVKDGVNNHGLQYQEIKCIDENGSIVTICLFDSDCIIIFEDCAFVLRQNKSEVDYY